jgi:hypothetical protein
MEVPEPPESRTSGAPRAAGLRPRAMDPGCCFPFRPPGGEVHASARSSEAPPLPRCHGVGASRFGCRKARRLVTPPPAGPPHPRPRLGTTGSPSSLSGDNWNILQVVDGGDRFLFRAFTAGRCVERGRDSPLNPPLEGGSKTRLSRFRGGGSGRPNGLHPRRQSRQHSQPHCQARFGKRRSYPRPEAAARLRPALQGRVKWSPTSTTRLY